MPKRAPQDDSIDPVRSRLAAAAAAPTVPQPAAASVATVEAPERRLDEKPAGGAAAAPREAGRGRSAPVARKAASLSVNRKIMVTPEEAEQIEETTRMISRTFGSRVTYSQVSRVVWAIMAGAEDAFQAGARRAPKLTAPSTGDRVGMAEYEQALTDFIAVALKRS